MRMEPDMELSEAIDGQFREGEWRQALEVGMYAWSRTVREAIGLPMDVLADRLGLSQPAVSKLERNEAAGAISIERLRALADALDCDLVYGFVPRRPLADTAHRNRRHLDAAREAHRKIPRLT